MNILETAKQLVEDTKRLVSSAAGSQEQLAEAAQKAVKTITNEVRRERDRDRSCIAQKIIRTLCIIIVCVCTVTASYISLSCYPCRLTM